MIYKAVFLIVTHLLFAAIFHHHFRVLKNRLSPDAGIFTRKDYIKWLLRKVTGFFSVLFGRKRKELFDRWLRHCSPLRKKWSAVGLYVSFTLLAVTGFLFTLVGSLRLFGLPLMLHVSLGGLFAVCLAVVLLQRAEDFFGAGNNTETKSDIPAWLGKTMFWLFTLAGFFLLSSALAMMLPVFSSRAQLNLFAIHRYAALTALPAAIAYLYISSAAKD